MRALARLVGLILVAAGFVGLVVDGTRSIVNEALSFSSIKELVDALSSQALAKLEVLAVQQVHPLLWDPVLVDALQLPASVVGFLLGVLLLWLGQKPMEPIGYLASH